MLQNAYFLAKIGADTAENEQHIAEILPYFSAAPRRCRRQPAETSESVGWQNFGKMLLVFGCIGSDFCKKICVLQHFSKSTRFSSWNFWNLTTFCKFCDICNFFAEISRKLLFFQTDFLRKFWDCSGAKGCKSCRAWKMLSNAYFELLFSWKISFWYSRERAR